MDGNLFSMRVPSKHVWVVKNVEHVVLRGCRVCLSKWRRVAVV
jgi:hypothetical protein